ncbi:hypothetical protein SEET1153_13674 [Salmonella enterica subsp. enterica serovar Typhimurium str. CDC_2009K1153]|nr:hypothetical protein SEET1153_13674 [Salmonella enterica subsp. enterica serovar Typhimurium str. CDC_2009K1153]ERN86228.1 hypothetical protein SETK1288_10955 [Salmonella enterica subsp. enterica serovar Typhimurium str. CDC_2009K1288]ERN89860.1 hypothetical protein SEET1158_10955 [Salmonella enterica subsp. enterica serovar Typhimurium str. CDC_2009K1158]ERN95761.1 hypothetical protein SEET1283_10970 [Salmonella enterica subsp. enterica serovar Typhimurium str. CDC_2009K1283]ERO07008.1 hypo
MRLTVSIMFAIGSPYMRNILIAICSSLLQMRASNNELSSFFRFLLKKLLIGIRELIN